MPKRGHVMVTRSLCRRHHGPSTCGAYRAEVLSEEEITLLAALSGGSEHGLDRGVANLALALLETRGLA